MERPDNIISLHCQKGSDIKTLADRDDDELMLLARGGMREAFDILVQRHQACALNVACKYLKQPELSRDAVQNTFVQVFCYLSRYQPRGMFRSFLYRVLLSQCRMAQRSARFEKRVVYELSMAPPKDPDVPEERVLANERRREVERSLKRLSQKLRSVLVLRFAVGLSYREISEALGLPVGTVKSRIFAGLEKLRKLIEGERQ
jgi:RNA polymerase sigma-70 factor (ECF subfamily)